MIKITKMKNRIVKKQQAGRLLWTVFKLYQKKDIKMFIDSFA